MSGTKGGAAARPAHVAIIMDGNGRWAQERGLPRSAGHQRGAERVREIVKAAPDLGIEVLTIFAFSTENWRRPGYEVMVLMSLFRRYIAREVDGLDQDGVEVRFLGDRRRLPRDLRRLMNMMEERTRGHTKLKLQIALSYGSRAEIAQAFRRLAMEVEAGTRTADSIDEAAISAVLETGGVPDPDLVIRTSGEMRISNFLLWQAAYAEFAFVEECWPEFDTAALERVIDSYGRRERRFGGIRASG